MNTKRCNAVRVESMHGNMKRGKNGSGVGRGGQGHWLKAILLLLLLLLLCVCSAQTMRVVILFLDTLRPALQ